MGEKRINSGLYICIFRKKKKKKNKKKPFRRFNLIYKPIDQTIKKKTPYGCLT